MRQGVRPASRDDGPRSSNLARLAFVGLAGAGSLGGAVFGRIMSDRLDTRAVSDLRTVLGALSAVGFLVVGLQLALVGWLSQTPGAYRLPGGTFSRVVWTAAGFAGVLAGIAAFVAIDADTSYRLQIGVQVAVAVAAMTVSTVPRAELLGRERWLLIGALAVVGPVVRVAVGVAVISDARNGVNLLPVTIAEVFTAATAFSLRPSRSRRALTPSSRYVVNGALASIGLVVTFVLSSIALRSRLGVGADTFNESAAVARVVIFLPMTITFLYFPSMARSRPGSRALRRAYSAALAWTGVLAAAACAAVLIAPLQVARLMSADDASLSVGVLRLLAIAWALASVSIVSVLQYIAHGSRLALAAWGAAVTIAIGQVLVTSATQLAVVSLAASAVLLLAVSVPAVLRVQSVLHATVARPNAMETGTQSGLRPGLTVVLPCYNPGTTVIDTIHDLVAHALAMDIDLHIIAVTDGSTDGSDVLIDDLRIARLTHLRQPRNMGKGAAVRAGFALADTELVAFLDADGDLPPSLLGPMLDAQRSLTADIVFGSKLHPQSAVHVSTLRKVYSKGYQAMIRTLFQLDIHDTQTGIKVFRHEVVDAILPALREDGFALDLELFIAARAAGFTRFVEAPVVLRHEGNSTISVSAVKRMFTDTLRLFWRAKIALAYTRSATQGMSGSPRLIASDQP